MKRASIMAVAALAALAAPAAAQSKPKAAVISVDVSAGVPAPVHAATSTKVTEGLKAAGYDVVTAQVPPALASCREGACLKDLAKAVGAPSLVFAAITRKDDSTIIVMRVVDADRAGETLAEVHEVCDLCGQAELEDRVGVAASALRSKAEAAIRQRAAMASAPPPPKNGKIRVAIVPGIAVNIDPARVDAIGQDMAEALNAELDIEAVGGLELRRQLPSDLAIDCVTTPSCVNDVAMRTGAQQLLFVVMVDSGAGGSIQIDTTWIEPSSGHQASRPAIDITTVSEARAKFASSAKSLLPDAPLKGKGGTDSTGPAISGKMTDGKPRHLSPLSVSLAVAGVAGVGLAAGFGLSARSAYNTCDENPGACTTDKRDSIRTKDHIADAGWIIGVGALVASGIIYATSGEAPHVMVTPTANGAVLGTFGRF